MVAHPKNTHMLYNNIDQWSLDCVSQLSYVHVQWQTMYVDWMKGNKDLARTFPEKFVSAVSDGAASSAHTLPRAKNHQCSVELLKQKVTGTLVHGKGLIFFRTFQNLAGDANLQCEVWYRILLSLEDDAPEMFLAQVDGGSENASLTALGFWAKMVEEGVVGSVQISRLASSHSHNRLDAIFRTSNRGLRKTNELITPQEFAHFYVQAAQEDFNVSSPWLLISSFSWREAPH